MAAVRVATYNTRDFLDDHHLAARVVRAVDPDVLCLQEVPRRLLRRLAGAPASRAPAACTGRAGTGAAAARRSSPPTACGVVESRAPAAAGALARPHPGLRRGAGGRAGWRELTAVSVHLSLKARERVGPHRAHPRGGRRPRPARARRRPQRGRHRRCLAAARRARPAAPGLAGPADLPGARAPPPARRRLRVARAAGAAAPRGRLPEAVSPPPATTAPPGSTSTRRPAGATRADGYRRTCGPAPWRRSMMRAIPLAGGRR